MTYQFNLVKVKRLFDGEKNNVGTCYLILVDKEATDFLNFSSPKLFWKRNYLTELCSTIRRIVWVCLIDVGWCLGLKDSNIINSFHSNVWHIKPLKTSERHKFFVIFRGYRKWISGCNGLMHLFPDCHEVSETVMTCFVWKKDSLQNFSKLISNTWNWAVRTLTHFFEVS